MVQASDKHAVALTTASHGNRQSAGDSKLIFDKYGNQYFLHQIDVSYRRRDECRLMHTSKLERQVQTPGSQVRRETGGGFDRFAVSE